MSGIEIESDQASEASSLSAADSAAGSDRAVTACVKVEPPMMAEMAVEHISRFNKYVVFDGIRHTKHSQSQKQISYPCSAYRPKQYEGTIEYVAESMQRMQAMPHTCKNRVVAVNVDGKTAEIKETTDTPALSEMTLTTRVLGRHAVVNAGASGCRDWRGCQTGVSAALHCGVRNTMKDVDGGETPVVSF